MDNLVTTDKIIEYMTNLVENKQPIDPNLWMDSAMKLNILLQGEQEKLYELEQIIAIEKSAYLTEGKSVAHAKTLIEAGDDHKECRKQRAKIDRIIEYIRLAKLHSRTASDLMRNQL